MLETEMMAKGFSYLSGLPQYKTVKQEVPFLSRCIDVILVDRNDVIISVEFKISKWRHAIEQAINHKLGADKSYICLPKRRITPLLLSALEESGVGLMLFDEDNEETITEVVPAADSFANIPAFRKMLVENINKIT